MITSEATRQGLVRGDLVVPVKDAVFGLRRLRGPALVVQVCQDFGDGGVSCLLLESLGNTYKTICSRTGQLTKYTIYTKPPTCGG